MEKIIGIDLGTTNSAVAVIEGGSPVIIENSEGERTTPSVIGFTSETDCLVGEAALNRVVSDPGKTVTSIKRLMGDSFEESARERENTMYPVVRGPGGSVRVRIKTRERSIEEVAAMLAQRTAQEGVSFGGSLVLDNIEGKEYSPEEISAFILQKLKVDAEAYLGEEVQQAVITVPAYFNDAQRQATRDAGRIAGLDVVRIISEPTAAALAYGIGSPGKDEKVLIFDLGGGTFDVSVLEISGGVFRVLATSGDNHLGGDDWDLRLVDFLADGFQDKTGIDLRGDPGTFQRLRSAAIAAKIALSDAPEAQVSIPFITIRDGEPLHFEQTLTRKRFEGITAGLRGRLAIPLKLALKEAELSVDDIDEVVLVGGSTKMPSVRDLVRSYVGKEPDISVNPDEAVALGAAIQGGMLNGDVDGINLMDVTPLSLGVETQGGVMSVLIARNTTIPAHAVQTYSTTEDGQRAVEIHVLQGERGLAADNKTLGRFRLEGIPAAPKGKAHIEVVFDIDVNGIVNVCAREAATGKEQQITISGSTALSEEEVRAMIEAARVHSEQDAKVQERVRLENEADSLIYWTRKALRRYAVRLPQGGADAIRRSIEHLEKVRQAGTTDDIGTAVEELREARVPLEKASD